jgi:hypothetical protein
MGVVKIVKGMLKPVSSELRSENQIICELGKSNWPKGQKMIGIICKKLCDAVRDLIAKFIPGLKSIIKKCVNPKAVFIYRTGRTRKISNGIIWR